MITRTKLSVLTALLGVMGAGTASAALADDFWDRYHGRRDEIIDRLQNQDRRIDAKVAEGRISVERAHRLHEEDHRIFVEEQNMAVLDGGHITKSEQVALNEELNAVSRQIGD